MPSKYKRIVAILVSILFAISERSTLFVFSAICKFFLVMSSFDFKKWCSDNELKESTIETLRNNDLDSADALKLVHADNVGMLDLTLGQRSLFMQALNLLNSNDQDYKTEEKHPCKSTPLTTKSPANDGGLEDLLKKIGGILHG